MSDDPLKPGGALEGGLFRRFLRDLSRVREPETGERIGAWRIVREIGRGGSGVVYLAERADGAYSQTAALKWLRGDRPVPGGRGVLARERELLASVDHPNIARLIDGGETEDGMLWFALDHVDGRPIDRAAEALALTDRLRLVETLCHAVHHAHRRGLIHGDIKPSNVLVDKRGRPRLLDFGISRLKGVGFGVSYGLTPDYASPEQRRRDRLTTASDIWQLGRLLDDLIGPAPAPSDLRAIVTRATAERPEDRYPSAAAFGADIAAWLGKRPVDAYRGGAVYRGQRFVARNLALSLVSVAALLIVLGGGAWMTWQLAVERDAARAQAERAEQALAETETALARARSLQDFLIDLFRASEPDRPRDELPDTQSLLEAGARRAMAADESVPDAERFGMLMAIAEVYQTLGRRDDARPLFERAVELARRHRSRRPGDLALALARQGHLAMSEGRGERARERFVEAESVAAGRRRALDAWVRARAGRGWLAWRRGSVERGLELLEPLVDVLEADEARRVQPATRLTAFNALASVRMVAGDLERALRMRDRTVELAERVHGERSRTLAVQLGNRGGLQIRLGRFEAAERDLRRAIDLYDRIFDRPVVLRAAAYGNLANAMAFSGRVARALATVETSAEEWDRSEGRQPGESPSLPYHRGRILVRVGRYEEAAGPLELALQRHAAQDSPPQQGPVMTRAWLARVRCRQSRPGAGRALLAEIDEMGWPDQPARRADILQSRAVCRLADGDPGGALTAIEESLDLVDWPGYALHRAQRWHLRGEALEALGHEQRAGESFERAARLLEKHDLEAELVVAMR